MELKYFEKMIMDDNFALEYLIELVESYLIRDIIFEQFDFKFDEFIRIRESNGKKDNR